MENQISFIPLLTKNMIPKISFSWLYFLTGLCREKVTNSSDGGGCLPQLTFFSLRRRMTKLLTNAIEAENDAVNTQMLLGGLMMIIEDNMCMERNNYESGG